MDPQIELKVKYRSSPNIAWVKYWGKYDEDYIIPINDSLGATLNSQHIYTETTVYFSSKFKEHSIILNNSQHNISKRIKKMFQMVKKAAYEKKYKDLVNQNQWNKFYFKVQSNNSFPTASGMASSASGLACLAVALNGIFDNVLNEDQLSELARLGSGSASRSVYGGLVRWKGVQQSLLVNKIEKNENLIQKLSKQCISKTVLPASKVSKIKILILLANNKQKQVTSTSGMNQSVKTSQLIHYRNKLANKRIQLILQCLNKLENKLPREEEIQLYNCVIQNIIKDSNQFHAICLDTYPPIFYLNQFSKQIIYIIDQLINPHIDYKVAYTFDAGPHAFLFMHEDAELHILNYLQNIFQLDQKSFNEEALKKLKLPFQKQETYNFKSYEGPVIKPHEIWSTNIGQGAHKIQ